MEFDKIYQDTYERLVSGDHRGLFRFRRDLFRHCFNYKYYGSQGNPNLKNKQSGSGRKSGSIQKGKKVHVQQKPLGQIPVEFRESVYDYIVRGRSSGRFSFNEFRHLFQGEIHTKRVSWKDCDTTAELQSSLYSFLDTGILIIEDIPRIPMEYEPLDVQYYGLDSEDSSIGVPHFYQFATRTECYISTSFRLLIRYIMNTHRLTSRNHVVWGTNIEYELGNIVRDWELKEETCDFKWTKGGLRKFDLMYDTAEFDWGHYDDWNGSFKCWDTVSHWKLSVKDMGKILTDKLQYDFNKLPKDFYGLKYAAMDAIVSRSYSCVQKKYYDEKGIKLKFTPGATALNFYVKGNDKNGNPFCRHQLYNTHTDKELYWLIEALRGGRTEIFSLKEYDGLVSYYDINSAYPYAMKFGTFPHPSKHEWVKGHHNIERALKNGLEGVAECIVDADHVEEFVKIIPYLGTKEPEHGRFVFPLGQWQAKYSFFEIRRALKLGYRMKFTEAIVYEVSRIQPFANYVDLCYSIRDEGTAKGDKILRDIGKSLGNNLFGKFGQRMRMTEFRNKENCSADMLQHCIRLGKGALIEKDEGFARHTNAVWSIYITAMCRDLLFNHMLNAWTNGNEVIYCDTDSIFISGGKPPDSHQTRLGALKHEGDLSYFRAILPKTYIYEPAGSGERIFKAKGVPKDQKETFIIHGQVEYKKPLKLREAMRRKNIKEIEGGMGAINAWVTVRKQLKGDYTKRKVLEDKSTVPHVLTFSK